MVVVAEEAVVVSVVVVVVVATTAVLVVTGTAELAAGRLEDAITEMQQQTSSIQFTAAARESSKNLTTHHESQKQSDDYKTQTERERDASACRLLTSINAEQSPQRRMQISFLPQQRAVIMMPLLGYRAGMRALREEAQTTVLELLVVLVVLAWFLLALSVSSSRFTNPNFKKK
jgi:Sec-independent protein translocase protein TatA